MEKQAHLQPQETLDKVAGLLSGKSEAEMIATIIRVGTEKGARKQYMLITCAEEWLSRKGARHPEPLLADTIMMQFNENCRHYGERAHPLSEKQVAVIATKLFNDFWYISNKG